MQWLDGNRIEVEPTKRPKKITGTKFAAILELDVWNTSFKTWCAITKTYEEPFEDNKYIQAGKVIEPIIVDYLNKVYFMGELKSATDIYGPEPYKTTYGNFFKHKVFGGMWDALLMDDNGKPTAVIEIKTTKRAEDWTQGAPENYALQAALYAYLLGIDDVVMVAGLLEESDYAEPEKFSPSTDNVIVDDFRVSERYPQFQRHIDRALEWWKEHVVTGISPVYDETKDADILKELRKNLVETASDVTDLINEAELIKIRLLQFKALYKDDEKRFGEIKDLLKEHLTKEFRAGDKQVAVKGKTMEWILSKTVRADIDKTALKKDGLLEKYTIQKESLRFTQKELEEDDV